MTQKTWTDYEAERLALQQHSPRFSRAELCRRAGVAETTMLKGIKTNPPTTPRPSKASAVRRELEAEKLRLTPEQRQKIELVLAAEGAMVEAGLR